MMNHKLEQFNAAFKKALSAILLKKFPNVIPLTVVDVLIDPSQQHGRVWLHTTPATMVEIEAVRGEIQSQLKEHVQSRLTPKLTFLLDDSYLNRIDTLFEQVEQNHEN